MGCIIIKIPSIPGTVVVKPEAVKEKKPRFSGPEFSKGMFCTKCVCQIHRLTTACCVLRYFHRYFCLESKFTNMLSIGSCTFRKLTTNVGILTSMSRIDLSPKMQV